MVVLIFVDSQIQTTENLRLRRPAVYRGSSASEVWSLGTVDNE
jgi:hypothetical protein